MLLLNPAVLEASKTMLHFSIIETGTYSAKPLQAQQIEVFQNKSSFKKAYQEIHAHRLPPQKTPEIDFEDAMLVIISLPEQATSGHRVSVQHIQKHGALLKITIKITKPKPGRLQTPMQTQPFVILKINKAPRFFSQVALFDETGRELLKQALR